MEVDKFDQWPSKAVMCCYVLLGSPCPLWGTKQGKNIIRHPTVAVRVFSPSSAPVSLQQGAMASPAPWICGVGAGGCSGF